MLNRKLFKIICILVFISNLSFSQNELKFGEWKLVVANQNFPEGIIWDSKNTFYSSNCYGGWITRISNGIIDTFLIASDSTFSKTNGLFALNDTTIIATDFGNGKILQLNVNGKRKILIDGFQGQPFNRPNDLTIDKNGNLYFTDPKSYGSDKLDGRIFFYNFNNGNIKLLQDSLAFPNGIAISPIDEKIYICESAKSQIIRFEFNNEGNLINKEIFIKLPGGDPDGINFDIEGNLFVAHFGSGNLYVISPMGEILKTIATPGKKPSNLEFGEMDRKTLYITEDETNSIYKININKQGFNFWK